MQEAVEISAFERVLRRDGAVTLSALLCAALLAWGFVASGIGMDADAMTMPDMAMPAGWRRPMSR
jgi:predicted metal-binding membrane protein